MRKRFPINFTLSLILLIASCIFSAVMLKSYSNKQFLLAIIPAFVCSAVLITDLILAHKNSLRFIAELTSSVGVTENEILYYSDTPAVILDEEFTVLWCNKEFDLQILSDHEVFGRNISELMPIDMKTLLIDGMCKTSHGDRDYKATSIVIEKNNRRMTYLSFVDITDFTELFDEYKRTRPSVIILEVDNYDDVLENFKESEKAQAAAAIQTLLEEFISHSTGVLKKLANDKFIAVIEEQHLGEIIESKFDVLDKARNISISGNNNLITLSIGVGRGAATLEESEIFAKQALDMCLGRGGDQAAVKTENGFQFFGGVAKGVEKKSKAKSRIISNALQEIISTSSDVYIMGHRFADLDAVGSGTGLAGAIRKIGYDAYFVVDRKKNLSNQLITKIDDEYPDLIITPDEAESRFDENSLLIIVDTHNAAMVESAKLYEMASHKVVIDHHRKSVDFINDAVIFLHEPYASSASEMVTEIIQHFKNLSTVPQIFAEALLSGIMLDTKNFVMRTGVRTFEAAAFLKKSGADTVKVKSLFTNTIDSYKTKSELITSAEIINKCAIVMVKSDMDNIRILAPQTADELLGIQDVYASFVIYPTGKVINISARSLGIMNVQVIMEKLGGGGHQTMAAVQLENTTQQKAKELLIEAIESN